MIARTLLLISCFPLALSACGKDDTCGGGAKGKAKPFLETTLVARSDSLKIHGVSYKLSIQAPQSWTGEGYKGAYKFAGLGEPIAKEHLYIRLAKKLPGAETGKSGDETISIDDKTRLWQQCTDDGINLQLIHQNADGLITSCTINFNSGKLDAVASKKTKDKFMTVCRSLKLSP